MEGTSFNSSKLKKKPNDNTQSVVLVAAGSFNPITLMHLRMFERGKEALEEKGINVCGGIISPVGDAYKKVGLLPSQHRVAMCQAAVASSDWIAVDSWEALQPTYTPTLRLLEFIQSHLEPGVRAILLCGADLVASFNIPGVWKNEHVEEIVEKYGVVCLERQGTDIQAITKASEILTKHSKNIHVFTDVVNDISSTKIRSIVASGKSAKYLIPDPVIEYIKQNALYTPVN